MGVMNNENRGAAGSQDGMGDSTRVGTAERDAAIALLAEHWHAGRLDPGEHELRVTRARTAVTQRDLDILFTDLPQPLPAPRPAGGMAAGDTPGFLEGRRDTIIALTPFVALVLFFLTRTWVWFLMIPVMGIVLYGPAGRRDPRRRGR
jgi:hypothetical protein